MHHYSKYFFFRILSKNLCNAVPFQIFLGDILKEKDEEEWCIYKGETL